MNTIQHRSIATRLAVAAALVGILPGVAAALGDYPNRPVKIVVPLPPGSGPDILPRVVADKLAARWKQPVVIENRPGAALNLGAEAVANAAPDGHTLLSTPPGPLVTNRFFFAKLRYDPSAFTPVTILARLPFVLMVGPSVPVADLRQFIAHAKANPGKLSFGSPGVGSPPHLSAELLKAQAGIDLLHVPYKGLVPAVADLVGGRLDMMFWDGSALTHMQAGKVKAIGVGSDARVPELPGVPAISELLPGFSATTWFAVVAPPKTPDAIAARISQAMAEAVKLPDVVKRFGYFHASPVATSPEDSAAFLRSETERWQKVIAAAGIKAQ